MKMLSFTLPSTRCSSRERLAIHGSLCLVSVSILLWHAFAAGLNKDVGDPRRQPFFSIDSNRHSIDQSYKVPVTRQYQRNLSDARTLHYETSKRNDDWDRALNRGNGLAQHLEEARQQTSYEDINELKAERSGWSVLPRKFPYGIHS